MSRPPLHSTRGRGIAPAQATAIEQAGDEGVVFVRGAPTPGVPAPAFLPVAAPGAPAGVLGLLAPATAGGTDVLQGRPLARAGAEGDRSVADQALADPVPAAPG